MPCPPPDVGTDMERQRGTLMGRNDRDGTHRVVVIGSGFGGLFGAAAFKGRRDVEVTVVAKTTHHLFQPLLYQVATGILSEGEIAPSTREILARQRNVRRRARHRHRHRPRRPDRHLARSSAAQTVTPYDSLIVAAGSGQSYFGNDEFAELRARDEEHRRRPRAAGPDLRRLRDRRADATHHAEAERYLTFVVVGAGPDRRRDGRPDRRAVPDDAAAGLPQDRPRRCARRSSSTRPTRCCPPSASGSVAGPGARLESMGVEVRLGAEVVDVDATGLRRRGERRSAPDRGDDEGVGGRGPGQPAR